MLDFMHSTLGLFRSKLSQRVAFWVFLSLIVIEGLILVPSYQRREKELLLQLEQVSNELLAATKQSALADTNMKALFENFRRKLNPNSVIKGSALYRLETGDLISSFGQVPELSPAEVGSNPYQSFLSADRSYYDVAWGGSNFNHRYILIVRHDASNLQSELWAYLGRIAGLILLISIVVTGSTMLVLSTTVIVPFLKLRKDFALAGEVISQPGLEMPNFETQQLRCDNEMGEVFESFHHMFQRIQQEIQQRQEAEAALRSEQEKSEQLLLNVLPAAIAEQLKAGERAIAQSFDEVTILFADLVNFTPLATQMSADKLVCILNDIFSRFDRLTKQFGLEKIKTIGDAYMVVAGVPTPRSDHGEAIVEMALAMQQEMHEFNQGKQFDFQLRIGINTGPVVAGVIGTQKFAYDLWGDAVNLASRMESHSKPGKIQVTEVVYQSLHDRYQFEHRGKIPVKGRGEMETYFLVGRTHQDDLALDAIKQNSDEQLDHDSYYTLQEINFA